MNRPVMNRIANCHNQFQNYNEFTRTLCLCAAGILRSPTMAFVLSQAPFNRNTRAAGVTESYALVHVDPALIEWADEIVCAEPSVARELRWVLEGNNYYTTEQEIDNIMSDVIVLDIPDVFDYRDNNLMQIIEEQFGNALLAKRELVIERG